MASKPYEGKIYQSKNVVQDADVLERWSKGVLVLGLSLIALSTWAWFYVN